MSLPPSKLSCERSAKLDQRLARLADIDSDCELTDREENCDLLEQKFGTYTHSHSNYLIRICKKEHNLIPSRGVGGPLVSTVYSNLLLKLAIFG